MKERLTLPNVLTFLRIVGCACLLFVEPLSPLFYAIYTISGLTDALDGWLARKLRCESAFGAKLDSVADLLFYAVMIFRILPILVSIFPIGIWILIGCAVLIRFGAYLAAFCKYRRFASMHTYLNKLTGLAAFLIPYFVKQNFFIAYSIAGGSVAALASLEELLMHCLARNYDPSKKTIFALLKREN